MAHSNDAIHWSADLMAHVGKELTLWHLRHPGRQKAPVPVHDS